MADLKFDHIWEFEGPVAKVIIYHIGVNYINKKHKLISNIWFDKCYQFHNNIGLVYLEKNGWNCLNVHGQYILNKWYLYAAVTVYGYIRKGISL